MVMVKGAMNKEESAIAVTECKEAPAKGAHVKPADAPAAAMLAPEK